MRQFEITYSDGSVSPRKTLLDASAFYLTAAEFDALADLQVGETLVDGDRDTWTRVA